MLMRIFVENYGMAYDCFHLRVLISDHNLNEFWSMRIRIRNPGKPQSNYASEPAFVSMHKYCIYII
jgi:hypothetical protein